MGRPRKPTAILELNGSFKHDPQRRGDRSDEPRPDVGLGDPPAYFDEGLTAVWDELSETCAAGVLTIADRFLIELTCQLMRKFRAEGLAGMTGVQLNLLISCLSRMGMTPSDRSKVGVQNTKETARDDLADLAAESRASLRLPI